MDNGQAMKHNRDMMDSALKQANENLVACRTNGEKISDVGDFISREIQQFFLDLEDSDKASEH